jgi:hypothetical protein
LDAQVVIDGKETQEDKLKAKLKDSPNESNKGSCHGTRKCHHKAGIN